MKDISRRQKNNNNSGDSNNNGKKPARQRKPDELNYWRDNMKKVAESVLLDQETHLLYGCGFDDFIQSLK